MFDIRASERAVFDSELHFARNDRFESESLSSGWREKHERWQTSMSGTSLENCECSISARVRGEFVSAQHQHHQHQRDHVMRETFGECSKKRDPLELLWQCAKRWHLIASHHMAALAEAQLPQAPAHICHSKGLSAAALGLNECVR